MLKQCLKLWSWQLSQLCHPAVAQPPYPPRVHEIWTLQIFCICGLPKRTLPTFYFTDWAKMLDMNETQRKFVRNGRRSCNFPAPSYTFLRTGCTVWFPVTSWHCSCFNRSYEYILSACVLISPGTRGCCLSLKDISGTAGTDTVKYLPWVSPFSDTQETIRKLTK